MIGSAQVETAKILNKHARLILYRNGDLLPNLKGTATDSQIEALKKGTANANRYNGKATKKGKRIFCSRAAYAAENTENGRRLKKFILTYRYTGEESLIQPHETKSHINRFLNWCRRHWQIKFYLYTLELTANGQYHYHFMVDANFINHKYINAIWCTIRGDYAKNAVRDLRTIYDANGAAGYAAKYFTKNQELEKCKASGIDVNDRLDGLRIWATSNNLVGCESIQIENTLIFTEDLQKTIEITSTATEKNTGITYIEWTFIFSYMKPNVASEYFKRNVTSSASSKPKNLKIAA